MILLGADRTEVALADLSTHGCCVDITAGTLRLGAIVDLRLQGRTELRGIVRWVRNGQAGLEFFQAIPEAIVEQWA